jgi:hypothetical protein
MEVHHQTKKGKQWSFGMKAHIGVDAESGLVHTVVGTAANVADVMLQPEVVSMGAIAPASSINCRIGYLAVRPWRQARGRRRKRYDQLLALGISTV